MKPGDRVKITCVDGSAGGLRQDIDIGVLGTVVRPVIGRVGWWWVCFDGQHENLSMLESELAVI